MVIGARKEVLVHMPQMMATHQVATTVSKFLPTDSKLPSRKDSSPHGQKIATTVSKLPPRQPVAITVSKLPPRTAAVSTTGSKLSLRSASCYHAQPHARTVSQLWPRTASWHHGQPGHTTDNQLSPRSSSCHNGQPGHTRTASSHHGQPVASYHHGQPVATTVSQLAPRSTNSHHWLQVSTQITQSGFYRICEELCRFKWSRTPYKAPYRELPPHKFYLFPNYFKRFRLQRLN